MLKYIFLESDTHAQRSWLIMFFGACSRLHDLRHMSSTMRALFWHILLSGKLSKNLGALVYASVVNMLQATNNHTVKCPKHD